jgi:hypothetical protein
MVRLMSMGGRGRERLEISGIELKWCRYGIIIMNCIAGGVSWDMRDKSKRLQRIAVGRITNPNGMGRSGVSNCLPQQRHYRLVRL